MRPGGQSPLAGINLFQFTHPGRGATLILTLDDHGCLVSIHAPREGCDRAVSRDPGTQDGFNSRTPGGVRRLFTPANVGKSIVSIHAPREGCDIMIPRNDYDFFQFQFTHPGRGATPTQRIRRQRVKRFNSRTPGGVRLSPFLR